jgi:hypothetical protein
MPKSECLDVVLRELRENNIKPAVNSGGKHIAVSWYHNTESRRFTCDISASDHRAIVNARADIRRILRRDGVLANGKNQ